MADDVEILCETLTKFGIQRECEKRGLPTTGNKKAMAKRIIDHDKTTAENDGVPKIDDDEQDRSQHEDDVHDEKDDDDARRADDDSSLGKVDDESNDDTNDDSNNDADDGSDEFFTPAANRRRMTQRTTSTPKKISLTHEQRPYSFRDVEDSIETFGAEDGQDVKMWMEQFEAMAKTAFWNDEQKMIMCRKKLVHTARRFVFCQRGLTTFSKLKDALIREFSPFVRASDVHRVLAGRKKKPTESTRDYIYEMQRISLAIDLDEPIVYVSTVSME